VSVFKLVRPLGFQRDEIPLAQDHKGRGGPYRTPQPISVCVSETIKQFIVAFFPFLAFFH
ncbi:MAG: hypothetical protein IJU12_01825, partial [Clostridia bacterium]|nr:hypothetical protein [Clostridia bacterium]